ncbi:MAG TPA: TraR/DksA C4-type zinc finger protein [Acidimicrobiia bacterium]|nr:TraR/DksA C4-type zinc finger protein [Acidimicrobiia bacterium]
MDTDTARSKLEAERQRLVAIKERQTEMSELDESQGDASGTIADYDQHPGDAGTETFERTKDLAVEEQLEASIGDIDDALRRLEEGKYGRCLACGRPIEEERLEALPEARFCLEHQQEADAEAEEDREYGDWGA